MECEHPGKTFIDQMMNFSASPPGSLEKTPNTYALFEALSYTKLALNHHLSATGWILHSFLRSYCEFDLVEEPGGAECPCRC